MSILKMLTGLFFTAPKEKVPSQITEAKPPLFIDVLREYVNEYRKQNEITDQTFAHYENRFRNIHLYLSSRKLTELRIDEVKHHHIDSLYIFLKETLLPACTNRHASRHMDLCKATTRYALKKEYINFDQLTAVRGKRDPKKKIVTLTKDEVKRWIAYHHTNAKTQLCADIFALQCFTGLSYIDVYNYQLETDEDGITWITNGRMKNDNQYSVMLNQYAKDILQKYGWSIPAISNQKYNEKLKDIAEAVGIKKHLTTHIGRKTFATLNAINGFGTGSLMDMLGHTHEETTNTYYINVGRERIKKEAERLGYPDLLGKTA